jgi:hypothetical protein
MRYRFNTTQQPEMLVDGIRNARFEIPVAEAKIEYLLNSESSPSVHAKKLESAWKPTGDTIRASEADTRARSTNVDRALRVLLKSSLSIWESGFASVNLWRAAIGKEETSCVNTSEVREARPGRCQSSTTKAQKEPRQICSASNGYVSGVFSARTPPQA